MKRLIIVLSVISIISGCDTSRADVDEDVKFVDLSDEILNNIEAEQVTVEIEYATGESVHLLKESEDDFLIIYEYEGYSTATYCKGESVEQYENGELKYKSVDAKTLCNDQDKHFFNDFRIKVEDIDSSNYSIKEEISNKGATAKGEYSGGMKYSYFISSDRSNAKYEDEFVKFDVELKAVNTDIELNSYLKIIQD